jgi:NADP-dependent 3-hydroxy acid dehydrogenase YdfG
MMVNLNDYLQEKLKDKTVLISGGTTGIGRATAIMLASAGAKVRFFGRHQQELDDTLKEIRAGSPEADVDGMLADVTNKEDIQRVFETFDQQFDHLDILINNAALAFQSIQEGSYEDWQYLVQTNLIGYLALSHEAINRMQQHETGHIVNVGSMSADVREKNSSVYVATKSAIQGFSEALRKEVNPMGIKVTLIEPGAVKTDMQDPSAEEQAEMVEAMAMLKAEDIAMAIVYALSQPKRSDVVNIKIKPLFQNI